jgi:hypothetical protein
LLAPLLIFASCVVTPTQETNEMSLTMKTGDVGPANEGKLVAVHGKIVGDIVDDRPWGWKIYLDDGSGKLLVFVATTTGIDVSHIRAGQMLNVIGLSGHYEQHIELLPRTLADVALLHD